MLAGPGIQSRVAERRTALRYPLRLPVVFSWQDEHGKIQGSDGYCRDLGSRGIYVLANSVPPLGVAIEMNVFLPRPEHSARPSEIQAIGRVVRSELGPAETTCGFAAMNHTTLLLEPKTDAGAGEGSRSDNGRPQLDEHDGKF
jgi:hypothetical protein